MKIHILPFLLLSLLTRVGFSTITDSLVAKPKPLGSVLRTVREIDMTNDTVPEVMQIETTKAKRLRDIKVTLGIYSDSRLLYSHSWKASDFFDPKDKLADTLKWLRLQRILKVFFSNQNFSFSDSADFSSLSERVRLVDIRPGSSEAKEFVDTPHKIFSVFAGRDDLFAITWLESKKKFVTLWRN